MGQEKEAVYLINGDKYLHLRENGAGVKEEKHHQPHCKSN